MRSLQPTALDPHRWIGEDTIMEADVRQIITLLMFFGGVALCFIRWPRGDRLHVVFCAMAVALWFGCWVLEPKTRGWVFVGTAGYMLFISLYRPHRRRAGLER
jgi:hypothetical protein